MLKSILSEGVDLVSEKRRFRGFLQDYAGCARVEQGLKLERRHLNVLMLGMRYRRFDAVVKVRGDAAGLNGLGDWLARQEGYKKGLCQWVEVVWSKSLRLATDIELDSKKAAEQGTARFLSLLWPFQRKRLKKGFRCLSEHNPQSTERPNTVAFAWIRHEKTVVSEPMASKTRTSIPDP